MFKNIVPGQSCQALYVLKLNDTKQKRMIPVCRQEKTIVTFMQTHIFKNIWSISTNNAPEISVYHTFQSCLCMHCRTETIKKFLLMKLRLGMVRLRMMQTECRRSSLKLERLRHRNDSMGVAHIQWR
jgi:hypothetical protein